MSRYATEDVDDFIKGQENINTSKKTKSDIKILVDFLRSERNELRPIEEIDPHDLNDHLKHFFINIRKEDGSPTAPVSSIGEGVDLKSGLGTHGTWFIDPMDSTAWVMSGYNNVKTLERYNNKMSLSGSPVETITLAQGCSGTGHVVNAGYLYCNLHRSNKVMKVQISTKEKVGEVILTDAGFNNAYPYKWGGYSDIDLALDSGNRLYAIYGSKRNNGNYAIALLDIDTLVIVATWQIDVEKRQTRDSFMANGMLYILDSNYHFTYRFDTTTNSLTSLSSSEFQYGSRKGYLTSLQYIPGRCELLAYDKGYLQTRSIHF
ncbi:unnamed protein product [Owenia fusiformis]|uniref:Uncharacterized protein n=1 Tax=Owenia fusiformis TaxID=6347 RepID=A0A8J1TN23_OWEFU|nr:unnamed protein product [Owenia fusiformis]